MFANDGYFVRRDPVKKANFEESYWGIITDPDGKKRDRREERAQYLQDIKTEMTFLKRLQPGKILDVGCGLGFLLSGLNDDWIKHGTELSAFASGYAEEYGEIFTGDLPDAEYESNYFDVVVIHHVIEHMPDPVMEIKEIFRILKPKGNLLFSTPDFDRACARLFRENYRLLHDNTHISLFSNDSATRFLRDHGFIIDEIEYPFFETRHFTENNLMKLFDTTTMSPPFYGNFMTFYCHKT